MYHILVVDDSGLERRGIKTLLKKTDPTFKIYEAVNGFEAWEIIQKQNIDIVFTDVRMPVMNGIELLKLVKNFNKNIQIVIFSAYSDFEYTGEAIKNNVDFYILKPINVSEFHKVLSEIIKKLKQIEQSRNEENEIIKNMVKYDMQFQLVSEADITAGIIDAISVKKWECVEQLTEELFENLEQEKESSFLYIRQIAVTILKKLYANVDTEKRGTIFQVVDRINTLGDSEAVKKYTIQSVNKICREFLSGEQGKIVKSQLIKRILYKIHQQYMEDISLESLAAEINLSPKYLGKLFKQEMGIGFIKYLTNYRLEMAKQFLQWTNKKITDISRAVGFQDASYFCHIFRQRYEMSPEQYRKRGESL